jgi:hypothetical protein
MLVPPYATAGVVVVRAARIVAVCAVWEAERFAMFRLF